jgi:TRAP-type C4-dicarboxylate transport system permease small subunit
LAQQNSINLSVPTGSGFENLQTLQFSDIISAGIQLVLVISAIVFFFILVMGGVRWITSGGDKGKTEAARNQITAALVGLVIVFAAWAIIQLIQTFFGISILNGLELLP